MRTDYCAQLTAADVGRTVALAGWVNRRRDFGGITFVDLRDRSGVMQLFFPGNASDLAEAHNLNREDVIHVTGTVAKRGEDNINPDMLTGEIEVHVKDLTILNRAKTPPFLIEGDGSDTTDETRLRYRYVDLRRDKMQRNLALRHRVFKSIRDYFSEEGFLEIETPFLTKSTPEGARDFLVPSRMNPGLSQTNLGLSRTSSGLSRMNPGPTQTNSGRRRHRWALNHCCRVQANQSSSGRPQGLPLPILLPAPPTRRPDRPTGAGWSGTGG